MSAWEDLLSGAIDWFGSESFAMGQWFGNLFTDIWGSLLESVRY